LGLPNQAGAPRDPVDGQYLQGFREVEAHQFQLLAIKAVPNILGASQAIGLFEAAYFYQDLPDGIKFNGPGVYLPSAGNGQLTAAGGLANIDFPFPNPLVANGSVQPEDEGYATKDSFGFRLVGRLEYPDVFAGVNLLPRIIYANDVKGVSQFFNEGAQSISIGVNAIYQQVWSADISYTSFFGGRELNGTDCSAALPGPTNPGGALGVVSTLVPGSLQGESACSIPVALVELPSEQSRNFSSHTNPNIDRDFFAASLSYSF